MIYVEIVLENKTRVTDRIYTYKVDEQYKHDVKIGKRVIVPFGKGNKKRLGIIVNILDEVNFKFELKYIYKIVDKNPIVTTDLIELAFYMRDRYLSDFSSAFQTVLPPGNWKDLEEVYFVNENSINDLDGETYNFFIKPRSYEDIQKKYPNLNITELLENNILKTKYIIKNSIKERKTYFYEYNKNFKLKSIRKNAKSQIKIIDYLKNNGKTEIKKLLKNTSTSSSVLKTLEKKEAIIKIEEVSYGKVIEENEIYKKITLNNEQKEIFNKILKSENNFNLIHGVTGSGKTEIYLHLTEQILKENKSVIILVPEISLTPQTIERFSGRFPNQVAVLHSKLTPTEKLEQWQQIENGDYKIVVGARSAVFAPVKNLGLLIIDEEHDTSYYSEKNPKYNTIEVAEYRTRQNNAKLVLGSATPSIESYYKAKEGYYNLFTIMNRATNSSLPKVNIVDMREELKAGNTSIFSSKLKEALEENLSLGNQSILFLNKRGHTSYIFCRRCGYVEMCQHCDVSMTYHKRSNRLVCHHCGRTKYKPNICPNCGSRYIKEFGAGTEKLEEECRKLFPDANIYRIDGDTNTGKNTYTNLYNKMKNKEIDILIGTQMITKGFDFKDVTLVGIVAADISLNVGDYKSSEKTFQLLTQVAGRAGRGESTGNVFIQTYKPGHYSIMASKNHDYESFYNLEIEYRKRFKYPPFYKLLNIKVSGKNRTQTRLKLFEILRYIQNNIKKEKLKNIEIIGPNPSPVNRINDFFRFDIHFKFEKNDLDFLKIIKRVLIEDEYKINLTGFKLSITVNPISFF
ncbi:primosomal protein N' [Miniphocaeibacter halophilus]|uniref:Primosomal protein N n=1 Tax=Miniphocaeibacter halophilus TaxID=2931922 RepID=A0AC61N216_9FIRM|nr:primosomal protein N' [Miniphocaeibacter halophilus]QQK07763.1 primosomal protein N' [Miniphocaeibacter halophilus]